MQALFITVTPDLGWFWLRICIWKIARHPKSENAMVLCDGQPSGYYSAGGYSSRYNWNWPGAAAVPKSRSAKPKRNRASTQASSHFRSVWSAVNAAVCTAAPSGSSVTAQKNTSGAASIVWSAEKSTASIRPA